MATTYRRLDRGTVRDDDHGHVHVTGTDDTSPAHVGYDADCGWCWLGAPHSADAHTAEVAP